MLVLARELEQELWLEPALALKLEMVSVLCFPLELEQSCCLSLPGTVVRTRIAVGVSSGGGSRPCSGAASVVPRREKATNTPAFHMPSTDITSLRPIHEASFQELSPRKSPHTAGHGDSDVSLLIAVAKPQPLEGLPSVAWPHPSTQAHITHPGSSSPSRSASVGSSTPAMKGEG